MDVNGGQSPNPNGSPIWPGTLVTGPLLAGNVFHGDGSTTLAGVGENNVGLANVGYVEMVQTQAGVTQATNGSSPGVFTTNLVIPAQSQIIGFSGMVTTAFNGSATTFGIGSTASATAFTAANAVVTGGALGLATAITPGTGATQIANWNNVGNTDVQIVITSTNTGAGVATVSVRYVQGVNNAS